METTLALNLSILDLSSLLVLPYIFFLCGEPVVDSLFSEHLRSVFLKFNHITMYVCMYFIKNSLV